MVDGMAADGGWDGYGDGQVGDIMIEIFDTSIRLRYAAHAVTHTDKNAKFAC